MAKYISTTIYNLQKKLQYVCEWEKQSLLPLHRVGHRTFLLCSGVTQHEHQGDALEHQYDAAQILELVVLCKHDGKQILD